MSDDMFLDLDRALAHRTAAPTTRSGALLMNVAQGRSAIAADANTEAPGSFWSLRNPMFWLSAFIVVQYVISGLLLLPGTQSIRSVVRALPYVSSVMFLFALFSTSSHRRNPPSTGLLTAALLLVVANLLHPTTQVAAGIAQCIFQLCIAAPLFWGHKLVNKASRLQLVLVIIFATNFLSAGVGLLQVYFPSRFMPSQFSLQMEEHYLDSLSYIGSDGRMITRPPGLTDVPGGAAVAGGLTALLGLGLALRSRRISHQLLFAGAGTIGLAAVYLAQVRSVLLMVIAASAVLAGITIIRGRLARGGLVLAFAAVVIVGSFLWASSLGGAIIDDRFLDIGKQGALATFQENRGGFLNATLSEMLDNYPFGAGVGRWGMMNTALGESSDPRTGTIHAEIQLTGWLLDGGFPLWILYGGAILVALYSGWRATASRQADVAELSFVVFAVLVFIVGLTLSGPAFNTQLGILFWLLASSVHATSNASGYDIQPALTENRGNRRNR